MTCSLCQKNQVTKYPKLGWCCSCYVMEYRKARPGYTQYGPNGHAAMLRDNFKCCNCGKSSAAAKLELHHIDGKGSTLRRRERNNAIENLITLCSACHYKVEFKKRGHPYKGLQGKWSSQFKKCITCGTTERKHYGRGKCSLCFERSRAEYKANWYQATK
jgi:5-methylcytosine-specific restriction endonuclease McrA